MGLQIQCTLQPDKQMAAWLLGSRSSGSSLLGYVQRCVCVKTARANTSRTYKLVALRPTAASTQLTIISDLGNLLLVVRVERRENSSER